MFGTTRRQYRPFYDEDAYGAGGGGQPPNPAMAQQQAPSEALQPLVAPPNYDRPNPAADYSGMDAQIQDLANQPIAPRKPGFFAKGGGWKPALAEFLGRAGDSLAGNTGYGDMRKEQFADLTAERRAQEATEAAKRMKQWEWINKPPDRPGIFDEFSAYGQMDPRQRPAFDAYLAKRFPVQQAGPPPVDMPYNSTLQTPSPSPAPSGATQPPTAGASRFAKDAAGNIWRENSNVPGGWEKVNVPNGSPLNPGLGR